MMKLLTVFFGLFGRFQLWRFSRRNTLVGRPARISGPVLLNSPGGGRLTIGEGVELRDFAVDFSRDGSVTLGAGVVVRGRLRLGRGGHVEIGAGTRFNKPCWMNASEGRTIRIGENCLFANVRIRTSDIHKIIDKKTRKRLNPPADVTIGDRVWIAERASIYKGVTIGADAVVGAHSVVTRSVPAGSVAVGVPAKVVREGITWKR